ncbi:AMP-binding protein, partial [Streptomyces sp. T21Q-yed]
MTDQPTTLCAAFQRTVAAHPDAVALRAHGGDTEITWRQYGRRVRRIATGLARLGAGPGEFVALMMSNRPEFHLTDTAVLHTGAVPYSVYSTNPAEAIAHTFRNSGCGIVVCEAQYLERVREAAERAGGVRHIVCVDGEAEGTVSLDEVEIRGEEGFEGFDFERSWRAVGPDDLATLVYTSGTTGLPKGVELTHAAVLADTAAAFTVFRPGAGDHVVSYLPDAHAANRWMCHYNSLLSGARITTLDDSKRLVEALAAARPTFLLAVPHVWYKLKAALETAVEEQPSPVRRALGRWALRTG